MPKNVEKNGQFLSNFSTKKKVWAF